MKLNELQRYFDEHPLCAPLQRIEDERLQQRGVTLYLKREDLLHPWVSGNKWRKLKYNLLHAKKSGHHTLLTFGGAYSNHILAVAAAGELFGFRTVGVIRGEAYTPLNPVLERARAHGMILRYLTRAAFRRKTEPDVLEPLQQEFGDFYLLPEGGSNPLAVHGCREIIDDIRERFHVVACPCGTGGTLAGLANGIGPDQQALGIAVLRGVGYLEHSVRTLLPASASARTNWTIHHDYHAGGYAKQSDELTSFIQRFQRAHQICLDPVYTGKMMLGLFDLVDRGHFAPGTVIVALNTHNHPDRTLDAHDHPTLDT